VRAVIGHERLDVRCHWITSVGREGLGGEDDTQVPGTTVLPLLVQREKIP
jgi:hypothetical protein